MAIITEEPDSSSSTRLTKPTKRNKSTKPISPQPQPEPEPEPEPRPKPSTTSPQTQTQNNPFAFWFYFTISASLLTLIFITISSLSSINYQDPKLWFLSLPTPLRHHFSSGRSIKVQPIPNSPSSTLEVFTIQLGPPTQIPVLIVHGLGCSSFSFSKTVKSLAHEGLHAVALDLPGSGFSDQSVTLIEEREKSSLVGPRSVWEIYSEIKEKGLFWGFDQLVENGYVDYEEEKEKVSRVEVVKPIELGGEEMGKVLGQVIDSLGLGQVDLVLHDSAFGLGANWVSENVGFVRSVTILDGVWSKTGTALPLWVLRVPVVREVVLGFGFVFRRAVEWCCSRPGGEVDAESHRVLLKGRDGCRAVVGMGMKLNCSFDLAEWGRLDVVKSLPMQVIWSSGSSKEWSEEGNRVANILPQARFMTHSGGRWPQDDTADELADIIHRFVSLLPKATRPVKEKEPVPDHIQQMLDEANAGSHQHHHHHHHHGGGGYDHHHDHGHDPRFMDAYGLGQGWGS